MAESPSKGSLLSQSDRVAIQRLEQLMQQLDMRIQRLTQTIDSLNTSGSRSIRGKPYSRTAQEHMQERNYSGFAPGVGGFTPLGQSSHYNTPFGFFTGAPGHIVSGPGEKRSPTSRGPLAAQIRRKYGNLTDEQVAMQAGVPESVTNEISKVAGNDQEKRKLLDQAFRYHKQGIHADVMDNALQKRFGGGQAGGTANDSQSAASLVQQIAGPLLKALKQGLKIS